MIFAHCVAPIPPFLSAVPPYPRTTSATLDWGTMMLIESPFLGYPSPHLPTFFSCCLVVDAIVDSKDDKEEETRDVADMMMYYLQL